MNDVVLYRWNSAPAKQLLKSAHTKERQTYAARLTLWYIYTFIFVFFWYYELGLWRVIGIFSSKGC
ncbi:unnamed protein product [Ixodes persulcatus]